MAGCCESTQESCFCALIALRFPGRKLIGPAEVTYSLVLGWGFLTGSLILALFGKCWGAAVSAKKRDVLPSKRWGVLNSSCRCPPPIPLQAVLEASGSLFPPTRGGGGSSLILPPAWLSLLVPSPLSWFCSEAKFCSSDIGDLWIKS